MIVQNSTTAVIILDRQRIIRYANDAAVRMAERSGKSNSDLVGTTYDDIIQMSAIHDEHGVVPAPESLPTSLALEKGIETSHHIFEQVYDRRHYWLDVSCVPLFGSDGKPEYAVTYFRDISDIKLQADRLAFLVAVSKISSLKTEPETLLIEKVRLITPSLADWCAIDMIDLDGMFVRLHMISRDSDYSASHEAAVTVPWEPETATCMGTVIQSGKSELYSVLRQKEKFREVVPQQCLPLVHDLEATSLIVIPIKAHGKIVGALSLAYTTSGRHYTQDDLEFMEDFCHSLGLIIDNVRLYNELEKRTKAKDAFLAALSHELRNPLAPIKSSIELLKIKYADKENVEELSVIEHQFDHLTKLLNDLLDASRYSFGKIKINRERVSLVEEVTRVIKTNQAFIDKKHLHLHVSLPDTDIVLSADQTRIEQALTNILHNAEKFTPEGGSITVTVREEGSRAVIIISDTGVGMGPQEVAHIFEGNFQTRNTKFPGSGLGIGLILVSEIVRLHGGTIKAASAGPDKGSSFTITLPLEEDSSAS